MNWFAWYLAGSFLAVVLTTYLDAVYTPTKRKEVLFAAFAIAILWPFVLVLIPGALCGWFFASRQRKCKFNDLYQQD